MVPFSVDTSRTSHAVTTPTYMYVHNWTSGSFSGGLDLDDEPAEDEEDGDPRGRAHVAEVHGLPGKRSLLIGGSEGASFVGQSRNLA